MHNKIIEKLRETGKTLERRLSLRTSGGMRTRKKDLCLHFNSKLKKTTKSKGLLSRPNRVSSSVNLWYIDS